MALALGACGGGAAPAGDAAAIVVDAADAGGGDGGIDSQTDDGGDEAGDATGEGGADDGGNGGGLLAGCPEPTAVVCPDPAPRFLDVDPIIEHRCVTCHFGGPDSPWPLTTYQDIADWQDVIRDDLVLCTMPPPDSQAGLTFDERQTILTWLVCGVLD